MVTVTGAENVCANKLSTALAVITAVPITLVQFKEKGAAASVPIGEPFT